jgi:hypothetical protein
MSVAAVVAIFVAVLLGTLLLADVSGSAAPTRAIAGHVVLALLTLVVVGVGAAVADAPIAWIGVVMLVVTIAAGATAWSRTPADTRPGNGILIAHGTAAAAALVLAILAAVTA